MNISLPHQMTLRPYQIPVWNAFVNNNVKRGILVLPRRNGKDLLSLNIVVAKAMQRVGLYLYIAPFYAQVRNIIWDGADKEGRRFLDYLPKEIIKAKYESRMAIELVNGSIIKFGGSDSPDSLVGGNPCGIVFTEASLHKSDVWEYLRPILAENGGWALFNGTPRGMNHFYVLYKTNQNDPEWFIQYLTCLDTGIPTLEAINKERKSGMPEYMIQQEFYCNWNASTDDVFIPLDLVAPCTEILLQPQSYQSAQKIMGVDVAFAENGDRATIAKRQGRMLLPLLSYRGKDNMAFASLVDQQIREWRPDQVFIDAGRGEGVYSRLWQMRPEYRDIVVPINFGGMSYDPLYGNQSSLMMGRLKEWFSATLPPSIPLDEDLIRDITTPHMVFDDIKSVIRMESKKHMKQRGQKSPDLLDALKLTFAEAEDEGDYTQPDSRMQAMGITRADLISLQSTQGAYDMDARYDVVFGRDDL